MPSVITDAGRALIAAKLAAVETLGITRVKFGDPAVGGSNPSTPTGAETDVASVQHTVNGGVVAGVINANEVAYTQRLDTSVGDFQITQVGFFHVEGAVETLVMLANVPPVEKVATGPGVNGNNYQHTEVLTIAEAATVSGISVPAESWQLDHTTRMGQGEGALRTGIEQLLGRFAALDGALLVSEIAPVSEDDCEATTGWAASSGTLELDAVEFNEGAGSLKLSGQAADATLTKTLGAAADWTAYNGVLFDLLGDSSTALRWFIEDSLGNRSTWDVVNQVTWKEHEIILASPDGNNGTDADLSDVLKYGLEGLDSGTVYNLDNLRRARLNDFALAAGSVLLEGLQFTGGSTTHAEHLTDWNGDVSAPPVLAPPGAGTRNDKVWLDLWPEPVGSGILIRAKLIVDAAAQADYVDGAGIQHRVQELAAILRTTAQRITAGMITDSRRDITIATPDTGALQSREEKGVANGYASLDGAGVLAQDVDGDKVTLGTVANARLPTTRTIGQINEATAGHGVQADGLRMKDGRALFDTRRFQNLRIKPNATNPLYQVDVDADFLTVEGWKFDAVDLTVDLTASGAGGLDTGSEANSQWYHLWAIADVSDPTAPAIALLLSLAYPGSGAPTLPGNYTLKQYLSAVYNTSGGDIRSFRQHGAWIAWNDLFAVLVTGAATSYTAVSVAVYSPPNALETGLHAHMRNEAGNAYDALISHTGTSPYMRLTTVDDAANQHDSTRDSSTFRMPAPGQQIYYLVGGGLLDINVNGFLLEL